MFFQCFFTVRQACVISQSIGVGELGWQPGFSVQIVRNAHPVVRSILVGRRLLVHKSNRAVGHLVCLDRFSDVSAFLCLAFSLDQRVAAVFEDVIRMFCNLCPR